MSNATKCDRCGGYFEQGGKNVRQGWGNMSDEYDLCPDCSESFDAWLERGQMADATNKSNSQFDVLKTVETAKNATSKNEIHNFNDSREHLEADVREYANPTDAKGTLGASWERKMLGFLDRQAAITERECIERSTSERIGFDCAECAEGLGRELDARCDPLKARIAELKAKLDAEAQHAREAWQLWGEADARAEQAETERDEMAQRIQTLELEIAKRDKGIERLKRRRGELTEQLGAMADRMAANGR